jgi:hypothetical protein
MQRQMIFRQSYYDSQVLTGANEIPFFRESEENSESVTTMTEDQAVKWLLNSFSFRHTFIESFFEKSKNVYSFFGIKEPFVIVGKKPGDIDILLFDKERPDKAIAIECKRLKVTSVDSPLPKVNNSKGIKHGVKQANGLQSLGFYKSFLMIILLDDSRHFDYPNTMLRNSKWHEVEEVYDMPWNEPLNQDVGIIFIKVTQPTGKHFNEMAGIGICIDKKANEQEQTTSMTNKIKELIQGP